MEQSHKVLQDCPVCGRPLAVRELECTGCNIQVRGHFGGATRFDTLTDEQMRFVETFLACRGVIRDVEAALAISYPTVKSRLENILSRLGLSAGAGKAADPSAATFGSQAAGTPDPGAARARILADLESGRIDAQTAIERLSAIKSS